MELARHAKQTLENAWCDFAGAMDSELIKGYLMQSNLLLIKEYKMIIKEIDKITYEAGTCFERKAKPKNTGISAQYNFL